MFNWNYKSRNSYRKTEETEIYEFSQHASLHLLKPPSFLPSEMLCWRLEELPGGQTMRAVVDS
jgi:hypothetical protein